MMVQLYKHAENPGRFFRSGGHDEYLQNFFKAVIENDPTIIKLGKVNFSEKDFEEFYEKLYENVAACEAGFMFNVSGNWMQKILDVIKNILAILHDKILAKKYTPANYKQQLDKISSKLSDLFTNRSNFEINILEKNYVVLQNLTILAHKCLLVSSKKGTKHFEFNNSIEYFIFKFIKERNNNNYKVFYKNFNNLDNNNLFKKSMDSLIAIFSAKNLPSINIISLEKSNFDFNYKLSLLRTIKFYHINLFNEPLKYHTESEESFKNRKLANNSNNYLKSITSLLLSLVEANETDLSKNSLNFTKEFINDTIKLIKENKINSLNNPEIEITKAMNNAIISIKNLIQSKNNQVEFFVGNKGNLNKVLLKIIDIEAKFYDINAFDLLSHIDKVKHGDKLNTDLLDPKIFKDEYIKEFLCNFYSLLNTAKISNNNIILDNSTLISK